VKIVGDFFRCRYRSFFPPLRRFLDARMVLILDSISSYILAPGATYCHQSFLLRFLETPPRDCALGTPFSFPFPGGRRRPYILISLSHRPFSPSLPAAADHLVLCGRAGQISYPPPPPAPSFLSSFIAFSFLLLRFGFSPPHDVRSRRILFSLFLLPGYNRGYLFFSSLTYKIRPNSTYISSPSQRSLPFFFPHLPKSLLPTSSWGFLGGLSSMQEAESLPSPSFQSRFPLLFRTIISLTRPAVRFFFLPRPTTNPLFPLSATRSRKLSPSRPASQ